MYFVAGIEGCIAKGIYVRVRVRFYVFGRMVGQETEGRGRKVVEMGGKSGIVRRGGRATICPSTCRYSEFSKKTGFTL